MKQMFPRILRRFTVSGFRISSAPFANACAVEASRWTAERSGALEVEPISTPVSVTTQELRPEHSRTGELTPAMEPLSILGFRREMKTQVFLCGFRPL